MKAHITAAVLGALLLPGCADMKLGGFSVVTPYGTVSSDKEGRISGTITIAESGK